MPTTVLKWGGGNRGKHRTKPRTTVGCKIVLKEEKTWAGILATIEETIQVEVKNETQIWTEPLSTGSTRFILRPLSSAQEFSVSANSNWGSLALGRSVILYTAD